MDQKGAIADIYDFDAIDVCQRFNYLFIMVFARRIYRNIAYEKILSYINDIDALDVAARLSDGSSYLAKFPRLIVDPNAQREAVTCIRCWLLGHTCSKDAYSKSETRASRNKKYDEKELSRQITDGELSDLDRGNRLTNIRMHRSAKGKNVWFDRFEMTDRAIFA